MLALLVLTANNCFTVYDWSKWIIVWLSREFFINISGSIDNKQWNSGNEYSYFDIEIVKDETLEENQNGCVYISPGIFTRLIFTRVLFSQIQSTLVISTSVTSNNRLSRRKIWSFF